MTLPRLAPPPGFTNASALGRAGLVIAAIVLGPLVAHGQPAFLGTWGTEGPAPGQFEHPQGVAVDATGHVFVIDTNPIGRVQIFSGSGDFLSLWSVSTPLANAGVDAIAVDGFGQVHLLATQYAGADRYRYYLRYSTAGTLMEDYLLFGPPAQCQCSLTALAVAANATGDGFIPVYGTMGPYNDPVGQVDVFPPGSGFYDSWGFPGNGPGQIRGPAGIAVDGAGQVYVADGQNHRIEVFTSAGTFLRQWGSSGAGDGQFGTPWGIAVGPSGHVYVTDIALNRIQEFTGDGTFVSKWGSPGSGIGQFSVPYGIAVDASESIYIADTGNHRIQKFGAPPVPTVRTSWGRIKIAYH